jgi:putative NADH-flavin reductase
MNAPPPGQARLTIVGATGMVGGYALRYALDDHAVGTVTAIARRKLGIVHPKLKEVLHQDFADCSPFADALSGQDAAVFCLGAYTGAVSDNELRKVTVDYTIPHSPDEASFRFGFVQIQL